MKLFKTSLFNSNIKEKTDIVKRKIEELKKKNDDSKRSIERGLLLQDLILKSSDINIKDIDYFVMLKQKDIVGGDFYWITEYGNKTLISVGDATGHGISAAMISILGKYLLNKILISEKNLNTNEILENLRSQMISSLSDTYNIISEWGIELAILLIDNNSKEVQYSGAKLPLYIIQKDIYLDTTDRIKYYSDKLKDYKLLHIYPDKSPIGLYPVQHPFTSLSIKLHKDDTLYLFSDGIVDQIGGNNAKKLTIKRFRDFLLSNQDNDMLKQKKNIESFLSKWMNEFNQVDDIVVIGIKILNKID